MPTELRRISFDSDELIEAICDYDKYASQKLTCGFVVGLEIFDEPVVHVSVELKMYGEPETLKNKLEAKELGAALVMYCLNHNIPIPANSVRYLRKSGANIGLFISMNEAVDGPATVLPDYFDYGVSDQAANSAELNPPTLRAAST